MTKNPTLPPQPMSRELMGKIVDEVFGGAIEDASVIEEIYAVIRQHDIDAGIAAILADDTPVTEADRASILEADLGIAKGRNAMLAKALRSSLDIIRSYQRMGYGDEVYMSTLCQAVQEAERALELHIEAPSPSQRAEGDQLASDIKAIRAKINALFYTTGALESDDFTAKRSSPDREAKAINEALERVFANILTTRDRIYDLENTIENSQRAEP